MENVDKAEKITAEIRGELSQESERHRVTTHVTKEDDRKKRKVARGGRGEEG